MLIRQLSILMTLVILLKADFSIAGAIVINAVGDIMLSGSGTSVYRKNGYDFAFAATTTELHRGDISIGNLEAPLAKGGKEYAGKRYRFRTDPQAASALRNSGFSVLTLANNHIMDFGEGGMRETMEALRHSGLAFTGAGENLAAARRPAIVMAAGTSVAVLAYSMTMPFDFYASKERPGTAPGYVRLYRKDIAAARKIADYVVVSFHWGTELKAEPSPYQVASAHGAVDAGADVVIGHHPHILQGIERYRNGVILYSLGNFAFGSSNRWARRSVIARIGLDDVVRKVELIPLNISNREVNYQPRPLHGKYGKDVIDNLSRISGRWGTFIAEVNGRYFVENGRENPLLARKGYLHAEALCCH